MMTDTPPADGQAPQSEQWQWTAKLPALVLGILFVLGGVLLVNGRWRYSVPAAAFLMAIGAGLVGYSATVHEWCAPSTTKFGMEFGNGFWHAPSTYDCLRLVYPHYGEK